MIKVLSIILTATFTHEKSLWEVCVMVYILCWCSPLQVLYTSRWSPLLFLGLYILSSISDHDRDILWWSKTLYSQSKLIFSDIFRGYGRMPPLVICMILNKFTEVRWHGLRIRKRYPHRFENGVSLGHCLYECSHYGGVRNSFVLPVDMVWC